jgi:hypothetical protein
LKYRLFLDWCEDTDIGIGDVVKVTFYHRASVVCRYDLLDDQNQSKLLVVRPINDEQLDLPINQIGAYVIRLGLIRSIEKAPSYERKRTKSAQRREKS